jgi:DNA repair protein RadC
MDSPPPTAKLSRIRALAVHERPQERLERTGPAGLSDTELLAMLVRNGNRNADVIAICERIIATAGSLAGLLQMDLNAICAFDGIGKVKGLQLIAVMEIARRLIEEGPDIKPVIDSPQRTWEFMRGRSLGLAVEKFWVLTLNRKNRLIFCREVSSGTATASLAHPREIFREVVRDAASALICCHNHPSGDPAPSSADIQVTRQLRKAAEVLQIELLDHVILGNPAADPLGRGFYSFADAGLV